MYSRQAIGLEMNATCPTFPPLQQIRPRTSVDYACSSSLECGYSASHFFGKSPVTSHQSFSNPNFLLASINSEPLFFYDVKTIMVKDQLYTTAGACLDSVNPLWHVQWSICGVYLKRLGHEGWLEGCYFLLIKVIDNDTGCLWKYCTLNWVFERAVIISL